MNRFLCCVLLAATAALADEKPKAEHAQNASQKTPRSTDAAKANIAVRGQAEKAHAKTKAVQEDPAEPQADTLEAKGPTKETQAQADQGGKLTPVPDAKALGMSILANQDALP